MDRVTQTTTDTVTLSLPEVTSLANRAARGAGYRWGHCEECGFAAVWLAEHRLDWADPLLRRLTGPRGATPQPAPERWASDGPICALAAGATLADFATLAEGPVASGVSLGRVLDPILLIPFLTIVAARTGRAYDGYLGEVPWLGITNTGQVIDCAPLSAEVADVSLRSGASRTGSALEPCAVQPIPRALYQRLDDLALRMTVPATEASATRAGAAGSDND